MCLKNSRHIAKTSTKDDVKQKQNIITNNYKCWLFNRRGREEGVISKNVFSKFNNKRNSQAVMKKVPNQQNKDVRPIIKDAIHKSTCTSSLYDDVYVI
jgi:hypothetical protein